MSPELINRKYNEKCDIWAAGIILFLLMTGKTLYTGSCDEDIMQNIKNNPKKFKG